MDSVVLTKAGPRLLDFYRSTNRLAITVNGPGMLFEKLELMTNRSAIEGATVMFYERVAGGLTATIECPNEPIRRAQITVEPHRIGVELSIELGPVSMYQSKLLIQTLHGESFRELIDSALGASNGPFLSDDPVIATLVAVRATGHQEHHSAAHTAIRRNANNGNDDPSNAHYAQGEH